MRALTAILITLTCLVTSVGSPRAQAYNWQLPPWRSPPPVPADNPMSDSKVELGRRLFYDIRLSGPGYMACATCHNQKLGFAERRTVSLGITGEHHRRNAMALANVGYFKALTWADHKQRHLEIQLRRPLFGNNPVEMGSKGHEHAILTLISSNSVYRKLFRASFPGTKGKIDFLSVGKAIAAFQRTLISARAPYDVYKYGGQQDAISSAAKRGETLFFGARLRCGNCHRAPLFTDADRVARYHNTGLYNVDGKGGLPAVDQGVAEKTGRPDDIGKFRTPSLRNIAVTAPYMHDGSLATLDDVISHYQAGGNAARHARPSPLRSPLIAGFTLTREERADLVAFLQSLTDQQFLSDPRFATPFQ